MYLKNTAGQFLCFQGVDSTNGGIKSGVTWTVRRCIDGTFAAGGGTVTEDGTNGWYKYAMAQADTNGNDISFNFTGTGAIPQTVNIITTAANPTDGVRFGLTALPNAAAGANTGLPVVGTQVPNANAGAAGGLWILGANAPATTTLTGVAASGATPATPALQLTGGAASTTGGGVAAQALLATGGAGAASTNGAAEGVKFLGGGTNTVASNAHGLNLTGASTGSGLSATSGAGATGDGIVATASSTNGNGITGAHSGTGKDLNATTTSLTLAKTTNITGFNDIAATAIVSGGAITTSGGAVSTVTSVTNQLTAAQIATGVWQDTTAGDFTVAASIGKSVMNGVALGTGLTIVSVSGSVGSVTGAVGSVTAAVTVGTNNDKTGYSLTATTGLGNQTANITGNLSGSVGSVTGAVGSVTANVNAVLVNGAHGGAAATLQLGGAGGLTGNITGNLSGSVGSVTGAVGSVTGAVGSVTGNVGGNVVGSVGSVTGAVTVGTNNDKTGYTTLDWTAQLTEAYRANGAAPTPAQALHEILAHLGEAAVSGTTKTIKKLDHSTTAETFTLDDATTPTSITRAT